MDLEVQAFTSEGRLDGELDIRISNAIVQ